MKKLVFGLFVLIGFMSCGDKEPGTVEPANVNINFKAKYDGQALVALDNYSYPDGRNITFSKFTYYLSDFALVNTDNSVELIDVEFFSLADVLSSVELSEAGYDYLIKDVPVGGYDQIFFNIGLDEEINATLPSDYPSDSPLARTGEYWGGWNSYVFAKIEGFIDIDNNGTFESSEGMSLHIGSDIALRSILKNKAINVQAGKTAQLEVVFDLKDLFLQNGDIYDIDNNKQLHSVTQVDAVNILADNLSNAVAVK